MYLQNLQFTQLFYSLLYLSKLVSKLCNKRQIISLKNIIVAVLETATIFLKMKNQYKPARLSLVVLFVFTLVTKYIVFKEADKITTHNEFSVEEEDCLVFPGVVTVESDRVEQILDGDVSDNR